MLQMLIALILALSFVSAPRNFVEQSAVTIASAPIQANWVASVQVCVPGSGWITYVCRNQP